MWKYFGSTLILSGLGLIGGFFLGYFETKSWAEAFNFLFIIVTLSLLELSLSFDNAVVNAVVLKEMTPLWRRRFLTWGMIIAVFGMRLIFPLAIVSIVASLSPWDALRMAIFSPNEYAQMMLSVHVSVAAFGGAFLMMVGLKFFFDQEKDIHWLKFIEKPLAGLGRIPSIEIGLVLILLLLFSKALPDHEVLHFIIAGAWGLVAFIFVDCLSEILKQPDSHGQNSQRVSMALFLYLEVLDASFSFDGVIGAFAITHHLLIITIGLGIGALFVRSLTILLVDKGTLAEFKYLEHGAFWAVLVLAIIMFASCIMKVPEVISGVLGILFIGVSVWSSLKHRKKHA